MAALIPLAAFTLLATASISGPISSFFRTIRRVVQPPRTDIDVPPEDQPPAVKRASPISAIFLQAVAFIFASVRQPQPQRILPAFREQAAPGAPLAENRSSLQEENALGDAEASKVDVVRDEMVSSAAEGGEESDADADATDIRISPPPYTRHTAHRPPPSPRAYMDFTVGWDDIWPDLPSPHAHVTYTYNSYFNAYTMSCAPPSAPACADPSPHPDISDADVNADALELVARAADEDLLWALHALSLADTAPANPSYPAPHADPPAGLSPFCPPPPCLPSPPETGPNWRLEWY